jgi:hypothetical protein
LFAYNIYKGDIMKFAQVGYGSEGQGAGQDGEGYTYIVSDNVRTGDMLTPIVKHAKNGTIFVTTGQVLSRKSNFSETINQKGEAITKDQLKNAYTGKELGVQKTRGKGGRFAYDQSTYSDSGEYLPSTYEQRQRALSTKKFQEEQGEKVDWSSGEATQSALKTAEEMEQYEPYESMMKRIGAK